MIRGLSIRGVADSVLGVAVASIGEMLEVELGEMEEDELWGCTLREDFSGAGESKPL